MIYVGMDTDSGNLLAVYEWTLHTRPTKRGGGGGGVEGGGGGGGRGDSRRLKQVRKNSLVHIKCEHLQSCIQYKNHCDLN